MIDERAVSDSLGFVLVFAIIISTVGVVYIGGFQSLDDARQYERMNNAERAFEVFADNVEDMTQRGAPSRATEIKLSDASLRGGSIHSITVNVTRHNDGSKNATSTTEYQPIVYESQTDKSNEMFYALGATFRASSGGTVMMEEPTWIINEDRVIVPVVQTVHDGGGSVTGSETVLVRTERGRSRVLVGNTSHSSDVYINVTSPRAESWKRYMEGQSSDVSCTTTSGTWGEAADCEITDVETVYVIRVRVNYEFL